MEAIKASNRSSRCVFGSPFLFQPATSWVLGLLVGCDVNSLSHTLGPPWSERLCPPDHEDWSLWNYTSNGSCLKSLLSEASELGCSRAERLGMTETVQHRAGRAWGRVRDAEHHLPGTQVLLDLTAVGSTCPSPHSWVPRYSILLQDLQAVNCWWRR